MTARFSIPHDPGAASEPKAPDVFVIWQLIDSAFPTGGFAHSGGLEAAWNHGAIRQRVELQSWIVASLRQAGNSQLPMVREVLLQPARLIEIDDVCEAWTSNHVANRASRLQGRALAIAAQRTFGMSIAVDGVSPRFLHFAPVFGFVAGELRMDVLTALRACLFMQLRNAVASAIRLNVIGPMEAQSLQHELSSVAEAVVRHGMQLALDEIAQSAPLLDLWQGAHDRLHTRLFQS
ncbi:MAG: urease accessory protein UreF [Verrucomicrobia bacterium]|nr:urease accessory protein UreF [Verrucomicrobiota bacterium]